MEKTPKISVIIPVYNSEKYLYEALESIRIQSFADFECIVLNDGSTDSSLKIIKEFTNKDKRFILVNKKNEGVGKTLKLGVEISNADIIVRMDSDDVSHKKRFEYQYRYLKRNPSVRILGSNVMIKTDKKLKKSRVLTNDKLIKYSLLLGVSPLYHPTIMMFKEDILKTGNYTSDFAEDFILWVNSLSNLKFKNLRSSLLTYRYHDSQTSSNFDKRIEVFNQNQKVLVKLYRNFNIKIDHNLLSFIYTWRHHPKISKTDKYKLIKSLIDLSMKINNIFNFSFLEKVSLIQFNFKIFVKLILKSKGKFQIKVLILVLRQLKIFTN